MVDLTQEQELYLESLQDVCQAIQQLNSFATLNGSGNPISFIMNGKIVLINQSKTRVYKIDTPYEYTRRVAIKKAAEEFGIGEIFNEEKLIKDTDVFKISEEGYLNEWHQIKEDFHYIPSVLATSDDDGVLSARLITDYPKLYDKICKFFAEYNIMGIHTKNCGIDQYGKLKIFDFFGDYYVNNDGTITSTN